MVKTLRHVPNPEANGGEQIVITTTVHDADDVGSMYLTQQIELMSYGNSVTLNLHGTSLTPEFLREMADDIERAQIASENFTALRN